MQEQLIVVAVPNFSSLRWLNQGSMRVYLAVLSSNALHADAFHMG
jgi:hypothetical protein